MENKETNKLLAEKVMNYEWKYDEFLKMYGWKMSGNDFTNSFTPTSSIEDAWKVVDKIKQYGDFSLYTDSDKWIAELYVNNAEFYRTSDEKVTLVICKLAVTAFSNT